MCAYADTCSLVVRPRTTKTTWKPVKPTTGTANNTQSAIRTIEHIFGLVSKSVLQQISRKDM